MNTASEIIDELHLRCFSCDQIHDIHLTNCPINGDSLGFPNVNIVNTPAENKALEDRYENALKYCKDNGYQKITEEFEKAIFNDAMLSINVGYDFLYPWMTEKKFIYSNYYAHVRKKLRPQMNLEEEGRRASTDSRLYGPFVAEELTFAALTLNGVGLLSYGPYSVILITKTVARRTSLLEENSWKFAINHAITVSEPPPKGFRSIWGKREQIAVAKCYKKLQNATGISDFPLILLEIGKTKMEDDFIECHIYGGLKFDNIAFVKGKSSQLKADSTVYARESSRSQKYAALTLKKIEEKRIWQELK